MLKLYHLITVFTSKKYKVCCGEESHGSTNLIKQLSLWQWSENEVTTISQDVKSTLQVQPQVVNLQIQLIRWNLC